ncbi:hypothetical protein X777_05506 [Ooceraea biroi]|uniref:Uncharacterized protein n=1 Tax=Ooceraea biroi TaxID=2015173 RepID=A0A026WEN2_OOCBI|nr:hypothetical protein X777_05506 [Ooceraea biroi]
MQTCSSAITSHVFFCAPGKAADRNEKLFKDPGRRRNPSAQRNAQAHAHREDDRTPKEQNHVINIP